MCAKLLRLGPYFCQNAVSYIARCVNGLYARAALWNKCEEATLVESGEVCGGKRMFGQVVRVYAPDIVSIWSLSTQRSISCFEHRSTDHQVQPGDIVKFSLSEGGDRAVKLELCSEDELEYNFRRHLLHTKHDSGTELPGSGSSY